MLRLTVTGPDGASRVHETGDAVVTIGRGSACTIVLNDPALADLHCHIELTPDRQHKVVDLESRSGIEVNGQRVNVQILRDGDRIRLGGSTVVVELALPDATGQRTDRVPILRTRRRVRPPRRRRVVLPSRPAPSQVFSFEDLRLVIESLVEERGVTTLDETRRILDGLYEEHKGQPLYESLEQERDALVRLLQINRLLAGERDLRKLLEAIMDAVIELTGAERGFLILREGDSLTVPVARNFDREAVRKPEFKVSHTIAEEVIRSGKPILSADALNDPGLPAAGSVADLKLRSLLCVPLKRGEQVVGCIYVDNRFEAGVFVDGDLPVLQALADQAAIAIENSRLFEENTRSRVEVERLNQILREKVERQHEELSKVTQDLMSARPPGLKHDFSAIIGRSRAMQEALAIVDRVLDTDEPVFVTGESGTGKELVARAIHHNSKRAKTGKLMAENVSAIPETLIESELFGHEKGAFTGAVASKPGLFELAHRGTLFLDEVGDMPPEMQKKLLRALQEGEIRRVGGQQVIKVDVRVISASNKDLRQLIRDGRFREDLYYRLNVVQIALPPLRDRREDIAPLVEHFLDRVAAENGQPRRRLEEAALWCLQNHPWPGNVRELENEIRRAVALSDGAIGVDHLREELRARDLVKPASGALKDLVREAIEDVERRIIVKVLEETAWKKTEAARILGISRPTLDAKIEAYGLERAVK